MKNHDLRQDDGRVSSLSSSSHSMSSSNNALSVNSGKMNCRKWRPFQKGLSNSAPSLGSSCDDLVVSFQAKSKKQVFRMPTIASPRKMMARKFVKKAQVSTDKNNESNHQTSISSELDIIGGLPSMTGGLPSMIGGLPSMIGGLPSMMWEEPTTAIDANMSLSGHSSRNRVALNGKKAAKRKSENHSKDGISVDAQTDSFAFDGMSLVDFQDTAYEAAHRSVSSSNASGWKSSRDEGRAHCSVTSVIAPGSETSRIASTGGGVKRRDASKDMSYLPRNIEIDYTSKSSLSNDSELKFNDIRENERRGRRAGRKDGSAPASTSSSRSNMRRGPRIMKSSMDAHLNESLDLSDVFELELPPPEDDSNISAQVEKLIKMVMEKSMYDVGGRTSSHPHERSADTNASSSVATSQYWGDGSSNAYCSMYGCEVGGDEAARRVAEDAQEMELIKLAMEHSLHDVQFTSSFERSDPRGPSSRIGQNRSISSMSSACIPRRLPPCHHTPIDQRLAVSASHLPPRSEQERGRTTPTPLSNLEMMRRQEQEMIEQVLELSVHDVRASVPSRD